MHQDVQDAYYAAQKNS
ncbi:hypothetical protein [Rothia santali]